MMAAIARVVWILSVCAYDAATTIAAAVQPSDVETIQRVDEALAVPVESQNDEGPPLSSIPFRPGVEIQRHYYDPTTQESRLMTGHDEADSAGSRSASDNTGACCAPETGRCQVLSRSACERLGYDYWGDGTSCDPNPCSTLVYSNVGPGPVCPAGVGVMIADDVNTTALCGCELPDAYARAYETLIGVSDSEGGGPDYTVSFGIYDACPFECGRLIPGTEGSLQLPDDGDLHLITIDLGDAQVSLPREFWVALRFTGNPRAGWVLASEAEIGSTERYCARSDPPPGSCRAGCGLNVYCGFYTQVWCQGDIGAEFLGYYDPDTHGPAYQPDPGAGWMADDLQLIVDDCEMSAYQIAVSGTGGPFDMEVELWVCLGPDDDPRRYRIDGAYRTYRGVGDGSPEVVRFDTLDEECRGVFIGGSNEVMLAMRFRTCAAGPILVEEPILGGNENVFYVHWEPGRPSPSWWTLYIEPYHGFNATIWCLGDAPLGACCDMSMPDADYCRETPHIECLSPLARWSEGRECDDPDAFDPPCGYSACCKPNDACENLLEDDCLAVQDAEGHSAVWRWGRFCGEGEEYCFLWACRFAEGDCTKVHSTLGCNDPWCCDEICTNHGEWGRYCCQWEWDQWCVDLAEQFCEHLGPRNDECPDAIEAVFDETCWNLPPYPLCVEMSNVRATVNPEDPGFCCHPAGPDTQGFGNLWFTFVATDTSAEIHTCYSVDGEDSLVEVYEVGDPSTPETACATLTPIACNDDGDCSGVGQNELNSSLDVWGLRAGRTYYIQLASKSSATAGMFKLLIESPSTAPSPPPNNTCASAKPIAVNLPKPFDLANATMDCPIELHLPAMQNDVWFEFLAFDPGLYVATTCPETGAGPATTLAVYNGAECPVDQDRRLAYNDDAGGECGPGSYAYFSAQAGRTYMIRVGGEDGGEPSGTLTVRRVEDCQPNGVPDEYEIAQGMSEDANGNGVPDECEPGDFDGDGDVDPVDLAVFVECLTGPCADPPCEPALYGDPICGIGDGDRDGDVDLDDFGGFQVLFTRP